MINRVGYRWYAVVCMAGFVVIRGGSISVSYPVFCLSRNYEITGKVIFFHL
jgi:hypothetical protein